MGLTQSSQEGGNKLEHQEINDKVNKMLTQLLDRHMEDFIDKRFCKKAKLFIRDDVLMKQAETDIGKLKEKIIIGKIVGGADIKPDICERLSHHFLKKLNLIASVNMTLTTTNERINAIKTGGQCFKDKPNSVSDINYSPIFRGANTLHFNKLKQPYNFSKRHVLEVDTDEIRKMAFDKLTKDKRGGKILKAKDEDRNYLPTKARNNLLIREISKPDICQKNGGKWLTTEDQLIEHGLKPNRGVDKYNKAWYDVVKTSENVLANNSHKLLKLLDQVMHEQIDTENGIRNKIYVDKPINEKQLNLIITDSKKIINNMVSEIDKVYLLTSSLPLVSNNEVEKQIKLEKEKKELEKRLKETKTRLSLSN
jgi:hypothetical protein